MYCNSIIFSLIWKQKRGNLRHYSFWTKLYKDNHCAVGRELKDGVSEPASITRDASLVYCKLCIWQCFASRPTDLCLLSPALSKSLRPGNEQNIALLCSTNFVVL